MTVTIFPKFITSDECKELNLWAEYALNNNMLSSGVGFYLGKGKRYSSRTNPEKFDRYPDVAYSIYDRISAFLDLGGLTKTVNNGGKDGIIVGCQPPGSDVFIHKDYMEPNSNHLLHCNILTQPADMGGELTVNDNKINVGVGDLHCYIVSKYKHSVTQIQGNSTRILWMFGYQLPESDPRFSRFS